MPMSPTETIEAVDPITIRVAGEHDYARLWRLAALDSADVPAGPLLLALVDGHARAAVSVADGSAIADPFHPSAEIVDLLRVRAAGLRGRRRRSLRDARHHLTIPIRRNHHDELAHGT